MASRGSKNPTGSGEPALDLQATEEQLVAIARAEAILNKRDPEQAAQFARAQILHRDKTLVHRQLLATHIAETAEASARARRRRWILRVLFAAGFVLAAVPTTKALLRETARVDTLRARLSFLSRPVGQLGFHETKQWLDVPPRGVTFEVPGNTCSALVATREGAEGALALSVERQIAAGITASGGVLWCSCEPETITVKIPGAGEGRRALVWLSASGRATGGLDVLATRTVDGFPFVPDPVASTCAGGNFQAWASRERYGDIEPLDAARPGPTAAFVAGGFEPVGLFPSDRSFAVVRAQQGRCYVAVPEKGATEIALRGPDGARLVPKASGAVVWCSHEADAIFSLWRAEKGSSVVVVLGAPAERAGGTLGVTLAAERYGYHDVESAPLPNELAKDARAALVAASVPASSIREADDNGLPGEHDDDVVAFSLRDRVGMHPEDLAPVPTVCLPEQDAGRPPPAFLCIQAHGQTWHRLGDGQHQGAVEGVRPSWLRLLGGASEEGALRAMAALMLFAQRLSLLGYEATTTQGVDDSPDGAVISGFGGGKGEVVAVGLSRTSPWITPLTDGPSWTLAGDPRVIRIPTGATKKVRGAHLPTNAKDRRVIVWRR